MATEFIYELITKYVSPILDLCGLYVGVDGTIIYRSDNKTPLKFVNQRYNGQPDVPSTLKQCVPLSDKHYLEISSDPEMEIFNPFTNRAHALGLLVLLREAMIPYCVSETKQNACKDEDDYKILANYLNIYNSVAEDGEDIVGFSNTEDPENVKDLYSYKSDDVLKSCFGLAVTIYKDINRKFPPEYADIGKAWRKIIALCNKWAKARPEIKRDIKEEKRQQYDVNHMELSSGTIDNSFEPRLYDFYTDFLMPTVTPQYETMNPFGWWSGAWNQHDKYVMPDMQQVLEAQNPYLTSLFNRESLTPVVENEITLGPKDYEIVESSASIPETQNVMTFDGGNVSVTQEPVEERPNPAPVINKVNSACEETQNRGFSFGSKPKTNNNVCGGYQQFNPGLQMAVNNYGWNMYNQHMMGNKPSYDMNSLDLTGGDIVNPFSAYM